jgi:hypothetical protein
MLQPRGGADYFEVEENIFPVDDTHEETQGGCCHNNAICKDGRSGGLYNVQTYCRQYNMHQIV